MAWDINDYGTRNLTGGRYRSATASFADTTPSDWIPSFGSITTLVSGGTTYDLEVELSFTESHDDAEVVGGQDETERGANYDAEGLVYWRFSFSNITGGPVDLGLSYRS